MLGRQQVISNNILKSIEQDEVMESMEELMKSHEVYTPEAIGMFETALRKSFNSGDIDRDQLEKGLKDLTKLQKRTIVNKDGHTQTVYVRIHDDGAEHHFKHGDQVKFEHKGEHIVGHVKGLKHSEKYDPYGTAEIHTADGKKYSKSLRAIEHHTEQPAPTPQPKPQPVKKVAGKAPEKPKELPVGKTNGKGQYDINHPAPGAPKLSGASRLAIFKFDEDFAENNRTYRWVFRNFKDKSYSTMSRSELADLYRITKDPHAKAWHDLKQYNYKANLAIKESAGDTIAQKITDAGFSPDNLDLDFKSFFMAIEKMGPTTLTQKAEREFLDKWNKNHANSIGITSPKVYEAYNFGIRRSMLMELVQADELGINVRTATSDEFYDRITKDDVDSSQFSQMVKLRGKLTMGKKLGGTWNKSDSPVLKNLEKYVKHMPKGHILNNPKLASFNAHRYMEGVLKLQYACYVPGNNEISFSDDLLSKAKGGGSFGWKQMSGDLESAKEFEHVFAHEVGHAVSDKLRSQMYDERGRINDKKPNVYKEWTVMMGWDESAATQHATGNDADIPRKNKELTLISQYAGKSPEECFAEYYSMYSINRVKIDRFLDGRDDSAALSLSDGRNGISGTNLKLQKHVFQFMRDKVFSASMVKSIINHFTNDIYQSNNMQGRQQVISDNLLKSIGKTELDSHQDHLQVELSELAKSHEVYTEASVQKYESDLRKAFNHGSIDQDQLEKGMKDLTHLHKKIITDKNGKQQTVYVREHAETKVQHEFKHGDHVTFEHKGQQVKGHIKGLKHHEVYDKFGTAEIHDAEGNKYSKSLRAIEHHDDGAEEREIDKVTGDLPKPKTTPKGKSSSDELLRWNESMGGNSTSSSHEEDDFQIHRTGTQWMLVVNGVAKMKSSTVEGCKKAAKEIVENKIKRQRTAAGLPAEEPAPDYSKMDSKLLETMAQGLMKNGKSKEDSAMATAIMAELTKRNANPDTASTTTTLNKQNIEDTVKRLVDDWVFDKSNVVKFMDGVPDSMTPDEFVARMKSKCGIVTLSAHQSAREHMGIVVRGVKSNISPVIDKAKSLLGDGFKEQKLKNGSIFRKDAGKVQVSIQIVDHGGNVHLSMLHKEEVKSTSLADPKKAYLSTSARHVQHKTDKKIDLYESPAAAQVALDKFVKKHNLGSTPTAEPKAPERILTGAERVATQFKPTTKEGRNIQKNLGDIYAEAGGKTSPAFYTAFGHALNSDEFNKHMQIVGSRVGTIYAGALNYTQLKGMADKFAQSFDTTPKSTITPEEVLKHYENGDVKSYEAHMGAGAFEQTKQRVSRELQAVRSRPDHGSSDIRRKTYETVHQHIRDTMGNG